MRREVPLVLVFTPLFFMLNVYIFRIYLFVV